MKIFIPNVFVMPYFSLHLLNSLVKTYNKSILIYLH